MNFTWKKTENCFLDSETYEYQLPITGEELLQLLEGWEIQKNQRLRRPVGIGKKDGVIIKTVLAGTTVRVSFPVQCWQAEKARFEAWLEQRL